MRGGPISGCQTLARPLGEDETEGLGALQACQPPKRFGGMIKEKQSAGIGMCRLPE